MKFSCACFCGLVFNAQAVQEQELLGQCFQTMSNKWEYFLLHFKCETKNHYESIRPLETY